MPAALIKLLHGGEWNMLCVRLVSYIVSLSTQDGRRRSPGAESGPLRPVCSRRAPSWVAKGRKAHSRLNMARSRATAGSNVAPSGSAIQASVAPRTT